MEFVKGKERILTTRQESWALAGAVHTVVNKTPAPQRPPAAAIEPIVTKAASLPVAAMPPSWICVYCNSGNMASAGNCSGCRPEKYEAPKKAVVEALDRLTESDPFAAVVTGPLCGKHSSPYRMTISNNSDGAYSGRWHCDRCKHSCH